MHRLMMTSTAYRQGSAVTPLHEERDPENALISRMPLRRMDAEELYDTMLLVAGRLNEARFGPPDPVETRSDGLVTPVGTEKGWRRSIYVQQQRKVIVTHFENFDFPQMNPNCVERRDSTVAPQALHLMNNGMVHKLAEAFARRVAKEAANDPARQVESVYLIALSRPPSGEEREVGLAALTQLTGHWAEQFARTGKSDAREAAVRALTTYCHTIINSAGFLYVD
jgi:hypothetical protein